jgi:hypothetical protein
MFLTYIDQQNCYTALLYIFLLCVIVWFVHLCEHPVGTIIITLMFILLWSVVILSIAPGTSSRMDIIIDQFVKRHVSGETQFCTPVFNTDDCDRDALRWRLQQRALSMKPPIKIQMVNFTDQDVCIAWIVHPLDQCQIN